MTGTPRVVDGARRDQTGEKMGESDSLSPFLAERLLLDQMMDDGAPFADLEAVIDRSQLDDDERAALWLSSWARASRYGGYCGGPATRPPRRPSVVRDGPGAGGERRAAAPAAAPYGRARRAGRGRRLKSRRACGCRANAPTRLRR